MRLTSKAIGDFTFESYISCNALLNSITQNPLESHIAAEVFRIFNAPIL